MQVLLGLFTDSGRFTAQCGDGELTAAFVLKMAARGQSQKMTQRHSVSRCKQQAINFFFFFKLNDYRSRQSRAGQLIHLIDYFKFVIFLSRFFFVCKMAANGELLQNLSAIAI